MSDLERIFAGMGIEEEPDPTDDDAPACFDSLPTEIQEIILRQCSPHVRLVCKEWNALYIRGLSSLFPQGRDPSDQPRSLMLLHRFLRDARHLTVLNLSKFRWRRIHPMPAYILEAISSLPLVSLSLDGFDRLQDPDLARVLHPGPCVQNLRALDLGSCNCLTDASLMLVARLLGDRLRSLNLRFMQAAPQPLPGSTSLFATPAPVGPAPAGLTLPGLASFVLGGSMPHLRHLNLAIWAGLSQALLESIAAELPQLRSLTLAFGTTNPLGGPRSFAVSVLTGLRGATALQTLSLEGCHLIMGPPSPSNPFTAPPALEALDVSRASISPEIFDCIAQLTRLKSLGMFMLAETLDSDMITQKLTRLVSCFCFCFCFTYDSVYEFGPLIPRTCFRTDVCIRRRSTQSHAPRAPRRVLLRALRRGPSASGLSPPARPEPRVLRHHDRLWHLLPPRLRDDPHPPRPLAQRTHYGLGHALYRAIAAGAAVH